MRKKLIISGTTSVIVIALGLFVNSTFCNPATETNYLIQNNQYAAPANKAFTDDNFYKCVVDAYNETNETNVAYTESLTDEQLKTITYMDCNEKNIKNVEGLNKLISLTHLYLADNDISNLNISKNIELTNLFIPGNKISSLDVSKNTKLINLHIYSNKLTELDISNNPNLKVLSIGVDMQPATNKIKNIDLSNNIKLEILALSDLGLISLDVSKNTELQELIVSGNNLTSLDITNNQLLTRLEVSQNQLTSLNTNDKLALKTLILESNQLTNLDLSNNENLEYVSVAGNNIKQIKFGNNNKLTYLDVGEYARISNVSSSTNAGNQLTEIDLSSLTSLKKLYVDNNELSSLDLSENIELSYLSAENNQLESVNITNSVLLEQILLNNNNLENIDISNNSLLSRVSITDNKLTDINLSNNELIENLKLRNNNLINLDVSNNPLLKYLDVGSYEKLWSNQITSLDVSNNPFLINLDLYGNMLTELNVSNNTKLQELNLDWNKITSLDLSNNLELKYLSIEFNNINELDVSKNTVLKDLQILRNPFMKILGVYKNNNLDLINSIPVKFPLTASYFLESVKDYEDNLIENNIKLSEAGVHNLKVTYNHNIHPYSNPYGLNVFDVDYTLYVIEANSTKYEINAEEGYIYTGIDIDEETILNNISLNYGEASIEDDKLLIKYEGKLIKEFDIVNVSSNKYDLTNEYIYVGTDELNLNNINLLNGTSVIENNKLLIKYNDIVLQEYLVISNSSNLYKFLDNNIYIGSNVLDIKNIEVTNGTKELQENKLLIKYKKDLLNEYLIKSINFGNLKTTNIYIVITEDLTYDKFISNITISEGLTYKIFNGETEINEGNISKGMTLKVYYNDEVIDAYEITDEYLDLSSLNIDEDKELIKDLVLGTTVSEFKEKISTSGNVTIVDKNNNELTDDKLITSGSKVKIELTSDTYEYTLSVKGDVTGTGTSTVSDVAKLYQYLKKKIDMEDCYKEAGNVVSTDNEIKINDVAKLYQFIKKKIESLED